MRMKDFNISKFGFILVLIFLMSVQVVLSLGVTQPIPDDLKLLRGDTARFFFQIQNVMEANKQSCTYSMGNMAPLVITFDEKETVIDAGQVQKVYATVSVPADAPIKDYGTDMTVSCKPVFEDQSGSVIHKSMLVPFTASVVETSGERKIREIPEKQKAAIPSLTIYAIIILVILIVVIGVSYFFGKKKKEG